VACGHRSQELIREVFYYGPWVSFDRAATCSGIPLLETLCETAENARDNPVYPLEHTAELLRHLRVFRARREVYWLPGVVDAETSELLKLDEVSRHDLRVRLVNGPRGTGRITVEKKGALVFDSARFAIVKRPHRGYSYRDLSSSDPQTEVFCPHSIIKGGVVGTRSLEVRPFAQHGIDFVEVIDPLILLCEASLDTGNPIVWE
jgi:hypothetical protein